MRQHFAKALVAASLGLAACDLDTTNPNAPTQETVVADVEGLIALGVGVQARMGGSTGNFIYSAGLLTQELGAITTAFSTISDAEGGTVPPGAGITGDFWATSYRTVKSGDTLSKIAKEAYGDANAYMKIFEANKPMLKDPNKIYPGQMLRIPA